MTLRSLFIATVLLSLMSAAQAHDPSLHEPQYVAPPVKAVPTTCVQLADTQRYSNDVAKPDIKALKARCDAETAAAARKARRAAKK